MQQLFVLRDKIYKGCQQKCVNGTGLNISMYIAYIREYVKCFNDGRVPAVRNAWLALLESECSSQYEQACQHFTSLAYECLQGDNKRELDARKELMQIGCRALEVYSQCSKIEERAPDLYQGYKSKLKEFARTQSAMKLREHLKARALRNEEVVRSLLSRFAKETSTEEPSTKEFVERIRSLILLPYAENGMRGECTHDLADNVGIMSRELI